MATNLSDYLADARKRLGKFSPYCNYLPHGDVLEVHLDGDSAFAVRIDDLLTVYHPRSNPNRIVGIELKGVRHLLESTKDINITVDLDSNSQIRLQSILFAYGGASFERHYKDVWDWAKEREIKLAA